MSEEKRALKASPFRQVRRSDTGPPLLRFGILVTLGGVLFYPAVSFGFPPITVESAQLLEPIAYASLLLVIMGLFACAYGLQRILRTERARGELTGRPPTATLGTIAYAVGERGYARVFALAALSYGLLYAFVSGTLVYRPWENFSEVYQAQIPSSVVISCCYPVGQVPQFVIYVTEHLGMLLIPLNIILIFAVSWLVGVNAGLTALAFRARSHRPRGNLMGGVGSFAALFTSCPSCAGLFFTAIAGGIGAASVATAFASLQTLFIGTSLPLLLITPYLTSKSLGRAFTGSCKLS